MERYVGPKMQVDRLSVWINSSRALLPTTRRRRYIDQALARIFPPGGQPGHWPFDQPIPARRR